MSKQLQDFAHIDSDAINLQLIELQTLIEGKISWYNQKPNQYTKAEIELLKRAKTMLYEAGEMIGLLIKDGTVSPTERLLNKLEERLTEEALNAFKRGDKVAFYNIIKP